MLEDKNQKKIEINGWRVSDLPIKYSEADYEEARAEIINKVRKIPGLVALFEYGWIPAPGISDMDLWLVFSDDAKKMYIPNEPILSEKTKYLMYGRPVVISEKHYRKMLYLDPWTTSIWPNGHRLLYQRKDIKRDLNFEKIKFSQYEKNVLDMLFVDSLLRSVCSGIPFYVKKQLSVRAIFEKVKNCTYIIKETDIAGKNSNLAFLKKFEDLRANWFELDQKEAAKRLIDIFCQSLLIGFEAVFSLTDWFNERSQWISVKDLKIKKTNFWNRSYLDKKAKNVYLNTFSARGVFTDIAKTPRQALELSVKSCREIKIKLGRRSKTINFYIVFQPFSMASISLGLASEEGILSNRLRKDIFTNQEKVSIFKPRVFQEKIKLMNEITQFYNDKLVINSDTSGFLFSGRFGGYRFKEESLKKKFLIRWLRRKFWRIINKMD